MLSALTPLEFLSRNCICYSDCTAVVDGDRRFTYYQMQHRVCAFGAALQQAGIAPTDRVAVLARNGLLPLEAHFAVPLIGAVLVTLNIRLQGGELATILNHSGARMLLGDADLLAPLQAIRPKFRTWSELLPITKLFSVRPISLSCRMLPARTTSSPSITPAVPPECPKA